MSTTGQQLTVGSKHFKLHDVLQAGLLEYKEEIEDITVSHLTSLHAT